MNQIHIQGNLYGADGKTSFFTTWPDFRLAVVDCLRHSPWCKVQASGHNYGTMTFAFNFVRFDNEAEATLELDNFETFNRIGK